MTIDWEEYKHTTRVLLAFWDLSPANKETILLLIDGLKYRKTPECGNTPGPNENKS